MLASRNIERLDLTVQECPSDTSSHLLLIDSLKEHIETVREVKGASSTYLQALRRLLKAYDRMTTHCPFSIDEPLIQDWHHYYTQLLACMDLSTQDNVVNVALFSEEYPTPPLMAIGPLTLLFWHATAVRHLAYYHTAIAQWFSCIGPTDSTTTCPDLVLPTANGLAPLTYVVSLDISVAERVREAHRRIAAIATMCGSAGLFLRNGEEVEEKSSLWFDLHRGLLELGGASCLSQPTSSPAGDESAGELWAERLTKRSFIRMLRCPFEDPIHTTAADLYVAFGNARSEKEVAGLSQGSDRKKLMGAKADLIKFEKNVIGGMATTGQTKGSSNTRSHKNTANPATQHQSLLLAYAWEIAKTVDGVSAFTFLLHECLIRIFAEPATMPAALRDPAFIQSAWPSMLRYATTGLSASAAAGHPTASSIGSLDSLSDMGEPSSGSNVPDAKYLCVPAMIGLVCLLRSCEGVSKLNDETGQDKSSIPSHTVGGKRPREEEEGGGGGPSRTADVADYEDTIEAEPLWSEASGLCKGSELALLLCIIAGRSLSSAPNALRGDYTFFNQSVVPILDVLRIDLASFLKQLYAESQPIDYLLSLLKLHLVLSRSFSAPIHALKVSVVPAGKVSERMKVIEDYVCDGAIGAANALIESFIATLDNATNSISIESFENFSPAEVAEGAFLVLNRLSIVTSLALPILGAHPVAHGREGPAESLVKAISVAHQRWEGIWRKLKALKVSDETNTKEDQAQQSALLRRVTAKAEEVVTALLDYKICHLLNTSEPTNAKLDVASEVLFLVSAQGKLL